MQLLLLSEFVEGHLTTDFFHLGSYSAITQASLTALARYEEPMEQTRDQKADIIRSFSQDMRRVCANILEKAKIQRTKFDAV